MDPVKFVVLLIVVGATSLILGAVNQDWTEDTYKKSIINSIIIAWSLLCVTGLIIAAVLM